MNPRVSICKGGWALTAAVARLPPLRQEDRACLLFAEDDPGEAARRRTSPVRPGVPSESAERKAATRRAREGHPVRRFRGLPDHLAPA